MVVSKSGFILNSQASISQRIIYAICDYIQRWINCLRLYISFKYLLLKQFCEIVLKDIEDIRLHVRSTQHSCRYVTSYY